MTILAPTSIVGRLFVLRAFGIALRNVAALVMAREVHA